MEKRDIRIEVLIAAATESEQNGLQETLAHPLMPDHRILRAASVEELWKVAHGHVGLAIVSEDLAPIPLELCQRLLDWDPRLHVLLLVRTVEPYRDEVGKSARLWLIESGTPTTLTQVAAALLSRRLLEDRTRDLHLLVGEVVEGEQRYRALFEHSRDALFLYNLEGVFLDANAAALSLTGYSRSDVHSLALSTILPPDELPAAIEQHARLLQENQVGPVEHTIRRRDGTRLLVETSSVLVRHEETPYAVLGIARDISERKGIERMLLLLQKAIVTTGAGISIKNPDNEIIFANPAEARMHGYRADELIGKPSSILGMPEARTPIALTTLAQWQSHTHETINVRKDGTRFPVRITSDVVKDDLGEPVGVVTVCEDITEFECNRRALERSEARLRSLVERLPDAIAVHRNGEIIFANPAMATLVGYESPTEIVERPLAALFGPQQAEVLLRTDCDSQGRHQLPELRWVRRDGREVVVEICALVIDFDGAPARMLVARDTGELALLRRTLGAERSFRGLLGECPPMRDLHDLVRQAGPTEAPVLVTGETGTGKEIVARAIHAESRRGTGPFVAVNCGALPDGLIDSELFGHERGAFTGAVRDRKGRFELASGGTLFLDEVGELSAGSQVRLLRALEEKRIDRVGGECTVPVDVRIVSATNRELQEETKRGRFRSDLYFRLCVVPIQVPPLRERGPDIILLAEHFLAAGAAQANRAVPNLSRAAKEALLGRQWPGNVRELQNAMQFALVKVPGRVVDLEHLPPDLAKGRVGHEKSRVGRKPKLEAAAVQTALREAGGNKATAARLLGVARGTLYRYLGGTE